MKGQCEISDGTILPLSEFDTWRQEMGYFVDLEIDAMDQFPPPEAAISRCKGVISLMLQDPGMQGCMKIWVYRYYWKKFSGPVAYKPDSKELFCEGSRDELQQK